jgi:DNA-binding response OmpR family regulator
MNTILVLDHQPHMLRFLCHLLAREGYRSLHALNHVEADRLLDQTQPDLLLVNHAFSRPNSTAALARFRRPGRRPIPVIVMSAPPASAGLCRQGDADLVVSRPFSPSALLSHIRQLLARQTRAAAPQPNPLSP